MILQCQHRAQNKAGLLGKKIVQKLFFLRLVSFSLFCDHLHCSTETSSLEIKTPVAEQFSTYY